MYQDFREKVTGAHSDRRQLLKMDTLAPGAVVTVTRIDRLAHSTFDLFAIVKQIVDAKAQFRSLAEPWADTGTSTGRLMIAVFGGLADVERDLFAPARPKAGAAPRPKESIWGGPLPDAGTEERGHQTPRAERYIAGIVGQLRPQHIHRAPEHARRMRPTRRPLLAKLSSCCHFRDRGRAGCGGRILVFDPRCKEK